MLTIIVEEKLGVSLKIKITFLMKIKIDGNLI
jgi:hypothetical protein